METYLPIPKKRYIELLEKEKDLEVYKKAYEELKVSFDELSKAFEATEHCCPYDNEKCSKTNCFVIGGYCARRSKKAREEECN